VLVKKGQKDNHCINSMLGLWPSKYSESEPSAHFLSFKKLVTFLVPGGTDGDLKMMIDHTV